MYEEVTLAAVKANSNRTTFPCDVLDGCRTAAAFFSAKFFGANDVIHLYTHGLAHIWLNDLDVERLDRMEQVYGPAVHLLPGDAFDVGTALAAEGGRFDVVVCDPFPALMRRCAADECGTFFALAARWVIAGVSGSLFHDLGIEPTAQTYESWLRDRGHARIRVDRLVMRNPTTNQGIYWAVLRTDG